MCEMRNKFQWNLFHWILTIMLCALDFMDYIRKLLFDLVKMLIKRS